MNFKPLRLFGLLCLFVGLALFGSVGCGHNPAPPPPLAEAEIPAQMQKAFATAQPELKEAVSRLTSALQAKDYPAAYQAVQALCNLPGQTGEQRTLAARALLTITGRLQAAQAQGDREAADALRLRQTSR